MLATPAKGEIKQPDECSYWCHNELKSSAAEPRQLLRVWEIFRSLPQATKFWGAVDNYSMENNAGEQLMISAMQCRNSFVLIASWPRQSSPVLGWVTCTMMVVCCASEPAGDLRQLPPYKECDKFLSRHIQEDRNNPCLTGSNGHLRGESYAVLVPTNVIQ